jgi:HK97 family phage major capsid protein
MSVRELVDKRNKLVATSREIIDGVGAEGFTSEQRATLEKIDKDLDTAQKDLDIAVKAEERASAASKTTTTVVPRNDPGQRVDDAKAHAEKTNREFRKFILEEHRGEFSFKGKEYRAAQADQDTVGGFTVPQEQFNAQLIQGVKNNTFVLSLATNFNITTADSLGAPSLESFATNAVWGAELSIGASDTGLTFGKRSLKPTPLATYIIVSKKLLRASAVPVEQVVRDNLAYALAQPEEQAFLNGSAANQPLGVFTPSTFGVSTGRDYISTSSSAAIASGDDIIETKYLTKQQYWGTGSWIINRFHHKDIRKLKDANSQYLWSPGGFGNGLIPGNPDRLLDSPIYISEYCPVSTGFGSTAQTQAITGSTAASLSGYVAVYGDFSKYWTVTALDFSVEHLVEVRALTNQDVFVARLEVDGMPVLAEAFGRLKLKGY